MKFGLWKSLEEGINDNVSLSSDKSYLGGLHDISEYRMGKYNPEVHLWIAVLIDAAKYRDKIFLNTFCNKICKLAKLNSISVREAFNRIWAIEDNVNIKK